MQFILLRSPASKIVQKYKKLVQKRKKKETKCGYSYKNWREV